MCGPICAHLDPESNEWTLVQGEGSLMLLEILVPYFLPACSEEVVMLAIKSEVVKLVCKLESENADQTVMLFPIDLK